MFQTFKNAWKNTELRTKLLYTLLIIVLFRIGASIPVPYVAKDAMEQFQYSTQGSILAYMGSLNDAFGQATLFALSVSPYITSSIVMQLLGVAFPNSIGALGKDEAGKKKLNMWTRIVTVLLAIITAIGYTTILESYGMLVKDVNWFGKLVMVSIYTAGAALVMWLAEKINSNGVGSGISIILFAGIIAGLPSMFANLFYMAFPMGTLDSISWYGCIIAVLMIAVIVATVILSIWITNSERRIKVNYAKRVVGRKMYGGQSNDLPLKLNMAGVMPIIFASSIASIPATIASFFPKAKWLQSVTEIFNYNSLLYILVFLLLIVGFSYFYILISFDPVEVANNIQQQGGSIAGRRPGKPTYKYLKKVLNRVTLIGAFFLGFIACLPMFINMVASFFSYTALQNFAFSGSSLLIIIGVILEIERNLESQIAVRNYSSNRQTRGLLEGGRRSKRTKTTEGSSDDKTSSN